jgi:hypothetical protein
VPDYHWDMQNRGAGYLTRYSNQDITQNMKKNGHKIAGNEWDPFDGERMFDLPATFATSFRRPLDRALSQFRFECIEERGCVIKNVTKWWDKRKDLTNVYTWTFANDGVRKVSNGKSSRDSYGRQELIGKALDVVAKFNLVMVMEWLAYAPLHVTGKNWIKLKFYFSSLSLSLSLSSSSSSSSSSSLLLSLSLSLSLSSTLHAPLLIVVQSQFCRQLRWLVVPAQYYVFYLFIVVLLVNLRRSLTTSLNN